MPRSAASDSAAISSASRNCGSAITLRSFAEGPAPVPDHCCSAIRRSRDPPPGDSNGPTPESSGRYQASAAGPRNTCRQRLKVYVGPMHQREWVDARRRRPRHFTVSLIAVAILAIPASVALFGVVLGAVPRDLLIAVLIGVVLLLGAGLMWGASYISNMVQCEK